MSDFSLYAAIFWTRGIARPTTGEISSLSCEEAQGCTGGVCGQAIWVVLFEVPAAPASVAAFTEREHEFRFVAVQPLSPTGEKERLAVSAVLISRLPSGRHGKLGID